MNNTNNTKNNNVQGVVNNQNVQVAPVINPINVVQPVQQPVQPVPNTTQQVNVQATQQVNIQPTQSQPVQPQRVVGNANNTESIKTIIPQGNVTSTATHDNVTPEKPLKEVTIDPNSNKGGNFKYFMVIVLFISLFALVYFLPDISTYINLKKASKEEEKNNVVITTGTLKCKLTNNDKKYDYSYEALFAFTESKLTKLTYTSTTKGDEVYDQVELENQKYDCDNLNTQVSSLSGVSVSCSLSKGTLTKMQIFNYSDIDKTAITSAYAEAGGIYPDYKYNQNIDKIESTMTKSGYTCTRIK